MPTMNQFLGTTVGFAMLYILVGAIDNLSTYVLNERLSAKMAAWQV